MSNSSLTIDNTFNCHENDSWWLFYNENESPDFTPPTIGENRIDKSKTTKKNLKIKKYIKIGDECSICLESIFHKSNAYINYCGHSFHYSCISTGVCKDINFVCPLCRENSIDVDGHKKRYINSKNTLDKLEDFWDNIHTEIPHFCCDYKHFKGMKKNCQQCITYRNTGKIYEY